MNDEFQDQFQGSPRNSAPSEATDDASLPFEGQSHSGDRHTTIGEELRRERELREITLQEISEDTKISIPNLKAIEDNDFQRLPGGIYTKNFIRAYCRYLGISEEKMVNHYLYQTSPRDAAGASREKVSSYDRSEPWAPWRPIALTVLAVLALATVLWFVITQPAWFGLSDDAPPEGANDGSGAVAAGLQGPPVPLNFTFRADDDTWVVVEVDGEPRMNRHLKRGEFFEVKAQEQIILGVADAGALAWTINGRTARPLGEDGTVAENLPVNQENWRSWLEQGAQEAGP